MKSCVWKICLLIFGVLLGACGYRFSGGDFPGGSQAIIVELFENRTNVIRVESNLTNDVINEITRLRKSALVNNREDADAILTGTITSITVATVSRTTTLTANERRVNMTAVVSLTARNGTELWRRELSDNEIYEVDTDDKQRTELNKREALGRASRKLAQRIYNGLTVDF